MTVGHKILLISKFKKEILPNLSFEDQKNHYKQNVYSLANYTIEKEENLDVDADKEYIDYQDKQLKNLTKHFNKNLKNQKK